MDAFLRIPLPWKTLMEVVTVAGRKTPGTKYSLSGNFLMVPLPLIWKQIHCWSRFAGIAHFGEFRFSEQRILSRVFLSIPLHGFLHIPLAVFLTIPLLNRLVPGFFSQFHSKIHIRPIENGPDWAVGGGEASILSALC